MPRVVYVGVVLRFSQKYRCLEQRNNVNIFFGCLTYLLRATVFSSAVEGRENHRESNGVFMNLFAFKDVLLCAHGN